MEGDHTTSAALVYVVAVIVAAAVGGRTSGLIAAVLSFLGLNFFFTQPVHTFRVNRVEDVVALFVFLGTAVFVAAILSIAIEQQARAKRQEAEARLLQELGSQLLAGTGFAEVVRFFVDEAVGVLGAASCEVELTTTSGVVSASSGVRQESETAIVGRFGARRRARRRADQIGLPARVR